MSNPKMKPCPKCGETKFLGVYKYDDGGFHVECDNGFNSSQKPCLYLGPAEGSIRKAIISHNQRALLAPIETVEAAPIDKEGEKP